MSQFYLKIRRDLRILMGRDPLLSFLIYIYNIVILLAKVPLGNPKGQLSSHECGGLGFIEVSLYSKREQGWLIGKAIA